MGVASGCGEQEVGVASGSGWNLWVWLLGVVERRYIYGQLRVSHGSHMKAAHTVLYMKKHTQMHASYPALDISCMSVV